MDGVAAAPRPKGPLTPDLLGAAMIATAAAVAFEFIYCVLCVGADRFFPTGTTGNGYVVTLAWNRLVPFFAALVLAAGVLVVGGVGVIRFGWRESSPEVRHPRAATRTSAQLGAVFGLGAVASVVAGLGQQRSTYAGTTGLAATLAPVAEGVAIGLAVAALVVFVLGVRLLVRGPFRLTRTSLVPAVVVGLGLAAGPYAAGWAGQTVGMSAIETGFVNVALHPDPHFRLPLGVTCWGGTDCIVVGLISGDASTPLYGVAVTATAGRSWRTAYLPATVLPSVVAPVCTGTTCWFSGLDVHHPSGDVLLSVAIGATGAVGVHARGLAPPQSVRVAALTCWSGTSCVALNEAPGSVGGSPTPGPTATYTTDGGAQWSTVDLSVPAGFDVVTDPATTDGGPWCSGSGTCVTGVELRPDTCRAGVGCGQSLDVLSTTDGGAQWTGTHSLPATPTGQGLLCSTPPSCVAGSPRGFYLSSDGGATWTGPTPHGHDTRFFSCVQRACLRAVALARTRHLVEFSDDGGASWRSGVAFPKTESLDALPRISHCSGEGLCAAVLLPVTPAGSLSVVTWTPAGGRRSAAPAPPPVPADRSQGRIR